MSRAIIPVTVGDFTEWRETARQLFAAGIIPENIQWQDARDAAAGLFGQHDLPPPLPEAPQLRVSKEFIDLARIVSHHRDPTRWALLYAILWRIASGEKHALRLETDEIVHRLKRMQQQVKRDAHKIKAFVRFREVKGEAGEPSRFVAWHRPDHYALPLVAPFFSRRFASMQWTILTPDESVSWDGEALHYTAGVPASEAPGEDMLENLWRDYYRAIFNPARIKLKMMRKEMPVRHWQTLPETRIIQSMLAEAPERVAEMIRHQEGFARSAAQFLPEKHDLAHLREAAKTCEGCPLYSRATQTVFGEGNPNAALMLVGEQPGDEEDLAGRPFIGPAGQVLHQAMAEAGLERKELYLTNAVKHFKYVNVNDNRQHGTPGVREVTACNPWLKAELAAVKPKLVVALGVTAARALIAPGFTMKEGRGKLYPIDPAAQALATFHPAAVLRARDEASRQSSFEALVEDLRAADALSKVS